MRVSLLTLGCKVNQAETARIETDLLAGGHDLVGLGERPDICIVNTCTVTARSDHQSRQLIRRAARAGAKVYVSGCYAELNQERVADMKGVDKVIGNENKRQLIHYIGINKKCNTLNSGRARTRRFLKVQDGCDFSCSYCLIWKARGGSRSEPPEKVVEEVQSAAREGVKEVVLTGIHLGLYGVDLSEGAGRECLSGLVERILRETAITRIRLTSLEVNEIDEHLLDLLADERLCSHLHIPLQSGDDGVLRLMNRKYTVSYFVTKIKEIKRRYVDMALGTDIIAGFPKETASAFRNTLRVAEDLPFAYMHVFPYSRRPGTEAAGLPDIVGHAERKDRAARLRGIASMKKRAYLQAQRGRVLNVLFEEKLEEGRCRGTSENYLRVTARSGKELRGSIVPVLVGGMVGEAVGGTIV
jgi:threonylcarbamoyladenosine tRNA methylthiotransferase MtaB